MSLRVIVGRQPKRNLKHRETECELRAVAGNRPEAEVIYS